MGEVTGISWADRTWSPWTGCTKISPACDGCYAAHLMDTRMGRVEWGEPGVGEGTRDLMSESYWRKPLAWEREAIKTGVTPWTFPSLCDPFDLAVPGVWHARFHELILSTPHVSWLLLTKRVGNVRKVADLGHGRLWSATNWAIGSTFANQTEWNRDGYKLREAGIGFEVMTFGSFEPLLSAIRFDEATHDNGWLPDWVIAGGETDQGGHKARPSHPDWFRGLRDQCAAAGVPFHFKQWGGWTPLRPDLIPVPRERQGWLHADTGKLVQAKTEADLDVIEREERRADRPLYGHLVRVGKKAAGRLLDGALHDARPATQPPGDPHAG